MMNVENAILDPFQNIHTDADHLYGNQTQKKKGKRRWDNSSLLTFSPKYMKTLEIIKNKKSEHESKKSSVSNNEITKKLDDYDEAIISQIALFFEKECVLRESTKNLIEDTKILNMKANVKNSFQISSPNHHLYKRPDNYKYIQEKGSLYWMMINDANEKCQTWISKHVSET